MREIVQIVRRESRLESDHGGELADRGTREQSAVVRDHDRRICGADVELPQQRLRLRVALEVDPGERHLVSCGEVAQAMGVGRKARADDTQTLKAGLQQQRAPLEKRLENSLTTLGNRRRRFAQFPRGHREHASRLAHARRHQRAASGEHVDVAGELSPIVRDDEPLAAARVLDDVDGAREHDEEIEAALAFAEQQLAGTHVALLAEPAEHGDLVVAQPGERDLHVGGHRQTSISST
jgi:hypothetical protein